MRTPRFHLLAAVVTAVALTGCGGDDDDDAPSGGSPVNEGQRPGGTELPAPSDSPRGETNKE